MSVCDFIIELNRLRKSSSESIDNTNKFDEFKEYIHVERTAERDFKRCFKEGKCNWQENITYALW